MPNATNAGNPRKRKADARVEMRLRVQTAKPNYAVVRDCRVVSAVFQTMAEALAEMRSGRCGPQKGLSIVEFTVCQSVVAVGSKDGAGSGGAKAKAGRAKNPKNPKDPFASWRWRKGQRNMDWGGGLGDEALSKMQEAGCDTVPYLSASTGRLALASGPYDTITMAGTLDSAHCDSADRVRLAENAMMYLTGGGRLLISSDSPKRLAKYSKELQKAGYGTALKGGLLEVREKPD